MVSEIIQEKNRNSYLEKKPWLRNEDRLFWWKDFFDNKFNCVGSSKTANYWSTFGTANNCNCELAINRALCNSKSIDQ